MVERKGVLVILGEEDRVRSPLLKTWDLEKVDRKLSMGTPVLLRSVKVQTGNLPHPVTGSKSSVHTPLNYLVIVSPPFIPSASTSATMRNFARMTELPAGSNIAKQSGRSSVSGRIFVLENDGQVSCPEEKPTSEKLDMLSRKSQYVLTLNMARCQRLDESSVADIHQQYENNIYTKGHYDVQIVKTIGWAQPSYVIPENNIRTLMATPL
ncbi:hypothetical protein PILCRDRAFT_16379 [Piloderma croceum F 1598]|uniref:Uncharacterized protein n=1 Tax=Piloderma croceum (strain F 1598) TaxID=765440 RepID=A0A0C3EW24_PILCF|nr:hypothetical protein PILCRDRAFT_16379 [Piloderma croceum F 1598]